MARDDQALFAPPLTFMGAPFGAPGDGCRAAIIGLPFDCGTHPHRIGSRLGPSAVREASKLVRRFNPVYADFDPLQEMGLVDRGDVRLTAARTIDALARIDDAVGRTVAAGIIPVTIGGDGMVSLGVVRALARTHQNLVLLHVDSHTDAYLYEDTDKYVAAAAFTLAAEEGL